MPEEEAKERILKGEIPKYILSFLKDLAEAENPDPEKLALARIHLEYVPQKILADNGIKWDELRFLYKPKDWIKKQEETKINQRR